MTFLGKEILSVMIEAVGMLGWVYFVLFLDRRVQITLSAKSPFFFIPLC